MRTHKKVIIQDDTPYVLNAKQRRLTRRLECNHEDITSAQERIVDLETKLEHLAHDNQLPIKDPSILSEIQDQLNRCINRIQNITEEITSLKESAIELEDQLSRIQYQINAHTPNDTILSLDLIKSALASDPRIKEVQLYGDAGYYEDDPGVPHFSKLSFRMNGVVATLSRPDRHTLDRQLAPTDTVYVPLPDLRVRIRRNNVSMLPIARQGLNLYARGLTCHPHITSASEGAACWGDFGGPIQESLDNKDFQTTIALTTLFLETIDPEDPAGSQYLPLIRKQITNWIHANTEHYNKMLANNDTALLWITYPDGSCLPIQFTNYGSSIYAEPETDFYKHIVEQCNYYQQNPDELKANNFFAPKRVIKLQGFESDPTFEEMVAEVNQMLQDSETA
ncbi:MAG: hypothetical protein CMJ25_21245 [Phycisphaerae bacterium]|nr:hypothetical protein [Phycisphaerae bacterium]|tara:strand:- start:17420 stop:18601 length:1182 start_codon:yes stop_codon:yes gene_type:complete